VYHAHLVGEVEPAADVDHQADLLLEDELIAVVDDGAELLAVHVLHGDVAGVVHLADLEDGHDVRVLEACRGPGLALEAGEGVLPREQRG